MNTTPAAERAAEALHRADGPAVLPDVDAARIVLTAALDVDEMALSLAQADGWHALSLTDIARWDRAKYRRLATGVRASILGDES